MSEKTKKPANPALISAVKAVAVLVVICLVCVLLLALCNDLLHVSDEERFNRVMDSIYKAGWNGGDTEWNTQNPFNETVTNNYGEVLDVKRAADGAYVIKSKGAGGYKGTVTIYIVVKEVQDGSSKDVLVMAWDVAEHDGETLMGNITSRQKNEWYVGKSIALYTEAAFAVDSNKVVGTTMTSTAINNAVKAACEYCVNDLKLVSTPQSEALDAVKALLADTDFADCAFAPVNTSWLYYDADNTYADAVGTADKPLAFLFTGTGSNGQVVAYSFGEGEDRQVVVLGNGHLVARSESLAEDSELVQNVVAHPLEVAAQTVTVDGTEISTQILLLKGDKSVYVVTAEKPSGFMPSNYTMRVVVSGSGAVESAEIVPDGDGWVPGVAQTDANKVASMLGGATLATVDSVYSGNKVSGATQSAKLITACVKSALTHYDAQIASNQGGAE